LIPFISFNEYVLDLLFEAIFIMWVLIPMKRFIKCDS